MLQSSTGTALNLESGFIILVTTKVNSGRRVVSPVTGCVSQALVLTIALFGSDHRIDVGSGDMPSVSML